MSRRLRPPLPPAELLLLLGGACLLFGALGSRSLWAIEGRWAEAARWMLLTGDVFTALNDGVPAPGLLKPAPSFWLIALASLGRGVSEASARAPSALGALLATLATVRLGRLWAGRDVGLLAGGTLLTTGLFAYWGRTASGDMLTVGCSAYAVLLLELHRRRPAPGWLYALAVVCALGSWVKGLLGFALPAVALVALLLATHGLRTPDQRRALLDELRRLFPPAHTLGAGALAAAVFLGPFLAQGLLQGRWGSLEQVYVQSFERFVGELEDRGSEGPLFYSYYLLLLAAPWSLWLPLGLLRRERRSLAWLLGVLLFFTLSSSRRSYYLLPILPAVALVVAHGWLGPGEDSPRTRWLRRAPLALLSVVSLVGALAAWALPGPFADRIPPQALPPALPTSLCLALASALFARALAVDRGGSSRRAAGLTVGAFGLVAAYGFWVVLPASEAGRTLEPFALAVRERVPAGRPLALYAQHTSSTLTFYLDRPRPLDRVPDRAALEAYTGGVIVRAREADWAPGWQVTLRERPLAGDPGDGLTAPCDRCAARGRGCKHYLLLERVGP